MGSGHVHPFRINQGDRDILLRYRILAPRPGPTERPKDWIELVNESERESEMENLRSSAQRGRPFGSEDWVIKIVKQFGLESTMNSRGRPKRSCKNTFIFPDAFSSARE